MRLRGGGCDVSGGVLARDGADGHTARDSGLDLSGIRGANNRWKRPLGKIQVGVEAPADTAGYVASAY